MPSSLLKKHWSDEKFALWRAVFAIVHVDGRVDPTEKKWMDQKIATLPLSDEQKAILEKDRTQGVALDDLLPQITKPSDRSFLLHQIRTIGGIDGVYSESEKQAFESMKEKIMEGLNLSQVEGEVQKIARSQSMGLDEKTPWYEKTFASVSSWLGRN